MTLSHVGSGLNPPTQFLGGGSALQQEILSLLLVRENACMIDLARVHPGAQWEREINKCVIARVSKHDLFGVVNDPRSCFGHGIQLFSHHCIAISILLLWYCVIIVIKTNRWVPDGLGGRYRRNNGQTAKIRKTRLWVMQYYHRSEQGCT